MEQLKKYIAEKQIRGDVIPTNEENQGRADFTNVAPGFYLVVQTGADEDYSKQYQDMDAFCISIPLIYEDDFRGKYLEYNVTVCPKLQTLPVVYKAEWVWYDGELTLMLFWRYIPSSPFVTTGWNMVTIGVDKDLTPEEATEILLSDGVWNRMGPGGGPLSEEEKNLLTITSSGWVFARQHGTGGSGGSSSGSDSALEEEAAVSGNDVSMNLPDDWLSGDTTENTGEGLPQTGLEVIRIYVLGGGGLLLILTGIAVLRSESGGKKVKAREEA